ncbi:MAG: hypothetical protein PHQ72_00495 [Hespellia sp.]|nr:hypothetical protein [Hespellia sp.]
MDKGITVFNYSIANDTDNREPLFYEQHPGSIVDISQMQFVLQKVQGYGYRQAEFILDRGYFCKANIREHSIRPYKCSGMTVKRQRYASDEEERFFHLYKSYQKVCAEHEQVESKIDRMIKYLNSIKGQKVKVGNGFREYFHLEIYE